MRRRTFLAAAPAAASHFASQALAAESPLVTNTIKILHAYPGGLVDAAARALSAPLAARWSQSVVVDPRPGANELIAGEVVAKGPKDGSQLLLATETVMANNLYLYDKLPFDPAQDLVPISELFQVRFALVTRGDLPASNLAEFIALMKKDGSKYNYGSSGPGGPLHLAMEAFRRQAGFEMTHVPYKTLPQLAQDLLGGRVDAIFISAPFAVPFLASGKLKMLGITGQGRLSLVPQIPSFAELGFPGVDYYTSIGLLAPRGTSAELLSRMGQDLRAVVRSEEFGRSFLVPNGLEAIASDGNQYAATLTKRRIAVQALIRNLNIRLE